MVTAIEAIIMNIDLYDLNTMFEKSLIYENRAG